MLQKFTIRKNSVKVAIAVVMLAGLIGSALTTGAYPAYVRTAQKFGAKNCLFCHKQAEGGEGWNERGQWLIDQKDKRKADAVDVEWLADYKPADGEKPAEKKEEPKKEKP